MLKFVIFLRKNDGIITKFPIFPLHDLSANTINDTGIISTHSVFDFQQADLKKFLSENL